MREQRKKKHTKNKTKQTNKQTNKNKTDIQTFYKAIELLNIYGMSLTKL
jgi:hypothetical protein